MSEWGNPHWAIPVNRELKKIGSMGRTRGSETSQYPEEEKTRVIPLVVASERGRGQTAAGNCCGVVGLHKAAVSRSGTVWKGRPKRVKAPYAKRRAALAGTPSRAGHVKSCLNLRGPSRKPKYSRLTDSERVPRGKGEKNPGEGSEKT